MPPVPRTSGLRSQGTSTLGPLPAIVTPSGGEMIASSLPRPGYRARLAGSA